MKFFMQKPNNNLKNQCIIRTNNMNKKTFKPQKKSNKPKQVDKSSKIPTKLIGLFIISTLFIFLFSTTSFCATAKIVSKMQKALETISSWIVKLATPIAAVSIGSGLLIKKFSFGDEERMTAGKKIIRSTIFSYAFVLVIDLVLDAIKSIMT